MANRGDGAADPRLRFEEWATSEALGRWPDARVRYHSRAKKGSHCWQIDAPGVGEFWLAATDEILDDPREVETATDSLTSARWLDRLLDVPTHGVQVKPGGRVFRWDPVRDDTNGYLAEQG